MSLEALKLHNCDYPPKNYAFYTKLRRYQTPNITSKNRRERLGILPGMRW